jgi:hypothetical protein
MITETKDQTLDLLPVEFIDTWLNENAAWVDSRVVDFALDLRTLLSADDPLPAPERQPVGVDA